MSAARDALDDGRLAEALNLQRVAVTDEPGDSAGRLFLFELLTLAGELREAISELRRVESDSPEWPVAQRGFLKILRAESRRTPRLRRPEFPVDPQRHLRCRWNAALCHSRGRAEQALHWLDRADASAPEITGFVDGREFHGLRDADDRFAVHFEVFIGSRTAWVAFEDVRSLRLEKAEHLLDVAYRAATLTLNDGTPHRVFLPLLYPGSSCEGDDIALGQMVDWTSADSGLVCGLGARVLTFGDEELALESCAMIELRKA